MSATSELGKYRGLQYESDHSTSIYETSDDDRDNFSCTNISNNCVLESNIFDEFDAIAESMATAKNQCSSLLRGKNVEKMEAIKENESELTHCLYPIPVSFLNDKSTAIIQESKMKMKKEVLESDCEEIFHNKSFEASPLASQEFSKAKLKTEVVESECEEVVEKNRIPDISSRSYRDYPSPTPVRCSITVLTKKKLSPVITSIPKTDDNNSPQVRSSLTHKFFLNKKEGTSYVKKNLMQTEQQDNHAATDWSSTDQDQPIKQLNLSSESSYENRFNFKLEDFQRIFCGMRVVSDEFILLNTGPVTTTHPYTNKYKMGVALRNTAKKGMASLALSVEQKQAKKPGPRARRSWFYRTYCIYDVTKCDKRVCSSIHFELENGMKRVQSPTRFSTDDVTESRMNDRTNLIKVQYRYR